MQVWTGTKEVSANQCRKALQDAKKSDKRKTRSTCAGCPEDADLNDAEVQAAVSFAMDRYNAMSNSMYRAQPVSIKKVTSQVKIILNIHGHGTFKL